MVADLFGHGELISHPGEYESTRNKEVRNKATRSGLRRTIPQVRPRTPNGARSQTNHSSPSLPRPKIAVDDGEAPLCRADQFGDVEGEVEHGVVASADKEARATPTAVPVREPEFVVEARRSGHVSTIRGDLRSELDRLRDEVEGWLKAGNGRDAPGVTTKHHTRRSGRTEAAPERGTPQKQGNGPPGRSDPRSAAQETGAPCA